MNWDEVGAMGQMLGSVAVLVTLAYVAAQVRQARRSRSVHSITFDKSDSTNM